MIERTIGKVDKAFIENSVKGYEKKKVEVALRNLEVDYEVV